MGAAADPIRRDMVARLAVADATVGQLAEPYAVSLQAVSKHLGVLEEAGMVTRTREAQRRPVRLEPEVFDLMAKWIERYRRRFIGRDTAWDAGVTACPRSSMACGEEARPVGDGGQAGRHDVEEAPWTL